ncbi:Yip1 family protein [Paracoccus sp. 1_MG-2023]|uniref:Yip1 family protein n=1 Tax=unclassified Paracoccus (in: a-proteobacteria) TaxID=2688777 RepID=UPI001C081E2A|nr:MULTISPECIES: Yip1 family protein [unclassified Paracoccus (in: a-proteobacteria)]MBU2956781.1 YIP1 family protein [Paracoccus sp. C2R09]MDO6669180.1 Yip1 family protein [Paracoccus sp. 1_MG-2023]
MTFDDFKHLVGTTFRNPDAAARQLIGLNLPMQARWMALMLAVSVSALMAFMVSSLFPAPEGAEAPMLSFVRQPLMLAAMQFGAIVLGAGLMTGVGRIFGGTGNFADALILTVWIEILLLIVQAAQVFLSLALPGLAGVLGMLSVALFLWLTVQFAKSLHGFTSAPKVLLVMFATLLAMGFVLSFLAAALGLMPEMPQ